MKVTVKINDRTFDVEVHNVHDRPVLATVDGQTFEVWPEETLPTMSPGTPTATRPTPTAVGAAAPAVASPPAGVVTDQSKTVPAPIPGVVIAIAVKTGDTVAFSQELCTIEAMKMKNVIRAGRDGQIAAIRISMGDHVNHGQVLMEYED